MTRLSSEYRILTPRVGVRPAERRVRPVLPLLIFVSLGLMLLSRLNHSALAEMRSSAASWMTPVLQAAIVPLEPVRSLARRLSAQVDLTSELERLRAENQKLSGWEWRARQLQGRLSDLEPLAKVVGEQRLDVVTARVIADSSGAFVRSVMINSGRSQDVRPGYPVINADGLVGRIVDTGDDSARALLANDLNSRIPVVIGTEEVRAIMAGDNGPNPRLIYLPAGAKISAGDDVSTSGVGGMFPRGLRIGKMVGEASDPRVALRANLDRLEYLSVLRFENPSSKLSAEIPPDTVRRRIGSGLNAPPAGAHP